MKSTRGVIENNKIMLDSIYKKVEEDVDIGLVLFLGDIQHTTPRDIKQVSQWRKWFLELNMLMADRDMTDITLRYRDDHPHPNDLRVVSVKGNHDFEIYNKKANDYTFFDELESEGLIGNPDQVVFNDNGNPVVFDLRNYGEADRLLPAEMQDKALTVAFTHDNIQTEFSDEFVKMIVEKAGGYSVEDIGVGVDLMINGHIHTKFPPQTVNIEESGKPCVYKICGSIARTSLSRGQMRDVGYGILLDTSEEELDVEDVEFDILPYKEYFDLAGYQHSQKVNAKVKDFTLGMDEDKDVIHQEDLEQTILESRRYSNKVKEKAIEFLEIVDSELEKEARQQG